MFKKFIPIFMFGISLNNGFGMMENLYNSNEIISEKSSNLLNKIEEESSNIQNDKIPFDKYDFAFNILCPLMDEMLENFPQKLKKRNDVVIKLANEIYKKVFNENKFNNLNIEGVEYLSFETLERHLYEYGYLDIGYCQLLFDKLNELNEGS